MKWMNNNKFLNKVNKRKLIKKMKKMLGQMKKTLRNTCTKQINLNLNVFFREILLKHRDDCVSAGNYIEAELAKNKIKELKQ